LSLLFEAVDEKLKAGKRLAAEDLLAEPTASNRANEAGKIGSGEGAKTGLEWADKGLQVYRRN